MLSNFSQFVVKIHIINNFTNASFLPKRAPTFSRFSDPFPFSLIWPFFLDSLNFEAGWKAHFLSYSNDFMLILISWQFLIDWRKKPFEKVFKRYRNPSKKKASHFSENVQNAVAKIGGVTPIEAINKADVQVNQSSDYFTSFGTNCSL